MTLLSYGSLVHSTLEAAKILGSIITEILCEEVINVKFKRLGMPDTFCSEYGSYSFLQKKYGLSPDLISKQVLKLLRS